MTYHRWNEFIRGYVLRGSPFLCPRSGDRTTAWLFFGRVRSLRMKWLKHLLLNGKMSRVFSAVLSAFLLAPNLVPAAQAFTEAKEPVCCCKTVCHCRYCRRHRHTAPPSSEGSAFDAVTKDCPCCPSQPPVFPSLGHALAVLRGEVPNLAAQPAGLPQTTARRRLTSIRLRQKRGPPAILFF